MRTGLVLTVIAICTIHGSCARAADRAIYACIGSSGEPTFSDVPCGDGRIVDVGPVTTVVIAPPSPEEVSLLERLAHEAASAGRAQLAVTGIANDGARRCADAHARLDRVRATKRRGYKASRAATLDARERDYLAQVERDCR